jgi:hypothetical protein
MLRTVQYLPSVHQQSLDRHFSMLAHASKIASAFGASHSERFTPSFGA